MTEPRFALGIGGRLVIDGEMITVCSVDGADVRGYAAGGERVRFLLTRVGGEPAAVNEEWRFGAVLLEAGARATLSCERPRACWAI
jgi:hypothetical protein